MEEVQQNRSLNEAADRYFCLRDEAALQEVVNAAAGLIRYFSCLYGKACDDKDLFQTGNLGLMKAIKNFNPDHRAAFITYASHCIIGEIRHMVSKQMAFYRPGCIVELQSKVDKVIEDYTKENEDLPTVEYIAKKINVRKESVSEVMKAGMVSFDEIDSSKIHSLSYESFRLPIEDKLMLYQAMKKLSDIQRSVLYMIFFQDLSQQQIADRLGINQKKVSRIKESTLQCIREQMQEGSEESINHF